MLVQIEPSSNVAWRDVDVALRKRLGELHLKLAGDLAPEQTAKVRGQIAFAKEILAWATPTPDVQQASDYDL